MVKGSFPGPPSPGLGSVMYPPASGAGADRRQDLQPEVFIMEMRSVNLFVERDSNIPSLPALATTKLTKLIPR